MSPARRPARKPASSTRATSAKKTAPRRTPAKRRTVKKAAPVKPVEPPPVIPVGHRLYILDVPFADRGVASANGARWHSGLRSTIYIGPTLPHGLTPYASHPYSWERWQEDNLNTETGTVPEAEHSLKPREHQIEASKTVLAAAKAGARGFLLADDVGTGKAQPLDSQVLTPTGFKKMGDLKLGEKVMTPNGEKATIIGIYPQGIRPVYNVTFSDKTSVKCDEDHLWLVNTTVRNSRGNNHLIKKTSEIKEHLTVLNGNSKWYIPMVSSVIDMESDELLTVDPYLLGALLGDGGLKNAILFSTADIDMIEELQKVIPDGVSFNKVKDNKYDWRISRPVKYEGKSNPLRESMKELGLIGLGSADKFIPTRFLHASPATRLAVLQGLMDTDGSVDKRDSHIEFGSSSEQLVKDVIFLVQSLGGWARLSTRIPWYTYKGERKNGHRTWRLSISLPPHIHPFRLKRKLDIYRPNTKYPPIRAIRSIEYAGEEETQCIYIDSPDHLYVTDNFIVTHNTVSAVSAVSALRTVRPMETLLIVCPLAVVPHWRRTLADMDITGMGVQACVINYDRLKKLLDVPESARAAKRTRTKNRRIAKDGSSIIDWDMVIADESHKLKNDSQRSTIFSKIAKYGSPKDDAPFVLWMSATAGQNPLELRYLAPLLAQITKSSGSSLKDFGPWLAGEGFHVTHEDRYDQWLWTEDPESRDADVEKIRNLMFARRTPVALRRIPQDIAGWPEVLRVLQPVQLSPEQGRMYEQAWTAFRREMHLIARGGDPRGGMVARLRFRQKASMIRTDGTIDHVLDLLDNGQQVAVSFQFLESLDTVKEGLEKAGVPVVVMDGRDPANREQNRLMFQTGQATVCLFTPVEGFSLHQSEVLAGGLVGSDIPRALVIHDPRYSGIETIQLEGRVHRDGKFAPAYYMYGEDTVEADVVRTLLGRVETTKALVGDDTATVRMLEDILNAA